MDASRGLRRLVLTSILLSTTSTGFAVASARVDASKNRLHALGASLPGTGTRSICAWQKGGLIYAEASDPHTRRGTFTVWSVRDRKLIFKASDPEPTWQRKCMVDRDGNAYYSSGYAIAKYDVRTRTASVLPNRFPWGGVITAATREARNGWIYGATERRPASEFPSKVPPAKRRPMPNVSDAKRVFAFNPRTGQVRDIAKAWDFTTAMVLDPSERYLYTVPSARGSAWTFGSPLLRINLKTNQVEVVAFLHDLYEDKYGYALGGTFGLEMPDDRTVYISMNASRRGDTYKKGFGSPVVLVVHVPKDLKLAPTTSAPPFQGPAVASTSDSDEPGVVEPTKKGSDPLAPAPPGKQRAVTERSSSFVTVPVFPKSNKQPNTPFRVATVAPAVDFLPVPQPYVASNWSSWAPGLYAPDGTFYFAAGDDEAPDGNSFVYGYSPRTKRLFLVGDATSAIPHTGSNWGYGEIHAGFVSFGKHVYTVTCWGGTRAQFPAIRFGPNYRGSEYLVFPLDRRRPT